MPPANSRWIPAFIVLFACYQAPEGLRTPALMLAFLPAAWIIARVLGFGPGRAYALEWNRSAAALLVGGLVLALAMKAIALTIGMRLSIYRTAAQGEAVDTTALLVGLGMLALSTFVASIAEDILTRGFWLRIPGLPWTATRFVLFSAVVYTLNHIYRLANGPTEWLMLFCFGLAYATALWKSGSLWAAVGLHWGWNFAGPALGMEWPYDVNNVESGRLLSAATHLLILAILLLLPRHGDGHGVGAGRHAN